MLSPVQESEDEAPLQPIPVASPAPAAKAKPPQKNLSKKERQALKQQELDDLDALLSEFKADLGETEATPTDSAPVAAPDAVDSKEESNSNKKKKPKKKKTGGTAAAAAPAANESAPADVDVAAVLRAKASKSGAKKPAVSEAQRIVAAEAKAQAEKKKKKSDKSKFNEMPDFN